MRKAILAAAIAAMAIPAIPAVAQNYPQDQRGDRDHQNGRDDHVQRGPDGRGPDGRGPGDRGGYDQRGPGNQQARNWQQYRNYDWNRPPRGQHYYAENYYRDGGYYQPRRLTRYDRIYRGRDDRYYCRRSDGTTGLIIGGVAGGLFGNAITSGGSRTLGTLLGAAGGAALGNSIDRNNVRCR